MFCKFHIFDRWYEGAHAWGVGNNQGIEGTNKAIKASHTFKRRAPIGAFMEIVKRMVKEWGEKDDSLLYASRMDFLEQDPSGLKLKTEGKHFTNTECMHIQSILKCECVITKHTHAHLRSCFCACFATKNAFNNGFNQDTSGGSPKGLVVHKF